MLLKKTSASFRRFRFAFFKPATADLETLDKKCGKKEVQC